MTVDELISSMDEAGVDLGVLTTHPFVSSFEELMTACEQVATAVSSIPTDSSALVASTSCSGTVD